MRKLLQRQKDTHTIFKQAITRNLAFLRIQTGLHLISEYINFSYEDYKPDLLKKLPEALHGTSTYSKVEECSDAYGLIDCLTDSDVPHILDNIRHVPMLRNIEEIVPEEFIDPDVVTFYLPMIKEGAQLVKENPLYQDILVMTVNAFEVYLRDTLHDLIVNNGAIAKKFEQQVNAQLNIEEDLELHRSVKQMIAHQVTQRSSFYSMKKIQKLFQTCFRKDCMDPFKIHPRNKKIDSVDYYLSLRHLIVHNGSIVDRRFLKDNPSCNFSLGEKHPVREDEVLELVGLTQRMVGIIEKAIGEY